MVLTVSISQIRSNISHYLRKASKGAKVVVRDEKRGATIAYIIGAAHFDKESFQQSLRKVSGILSSQAHPEWKTKTDITSWLIKSRLADDRKF